MSVGYQSIGKVRRRIAVALGAFALLLTTAAAPAVAINKFCSNGYEVWIKSNLVSGSIRYHHWHDYPSGTGHTVYHNYTGWAYTDTNQEDVTGALYGADGTVNGFTAYCKAVPQ